MKNVVSPGCLWDNNNQAITTPFLINLFKCNSEKPH